MLFTFFLIANRYLKFREPKLTHCMLMIETMLVTNKFGVEKTT